MPITPPEGSRAATDPDSVLLNLTRAEIDKVLHYVHPIPLGKGFTRDFLAKNYPGWELSAIMNQFSKAGLIEGDIMNRFQVTPRAAGLIVYRDQEQEVIWMTDDEWEEHISQQLATHPLHREGGGSALVPGSQLNLDSPEGLQQAARQIADQILGNSLPASRHRRRRQP